MVQAYAFLNVVTWLATGWVLLRWLPPRGGDGFFRWAAVMFSHGLILSVRGALPDGPSLLLLLLGVACLEKSRRGSAIGFFAASILCRETLVLGAAASVIEPSARRWPDLRRIVVSLVLMILPFVLWLAYVKLKTEATGEAGSRNFEVPLTAFFQKCLLLVGDASPSNFNSWAYMAAVLAVIAITIQFGFFAFRWRLQDHWWRIGASFAGLMTVLGMAVWEGYPGAFMRVLLPMTVAFNIAVPRGRRWLPLLIVGNLGVFGGIQELAKPLADFCRWEGDRRVISSITMNLGEGWNEPEAGNGHRWSWCAQQGELLFENHTGAPVQVGISATIACDSPRVVTLEGPSGILWDGGLIAKKATLQIGTLILPPGRSTLRFSSDRAAQQGPGSDTRLMAFAVMDFTMKVEPVLDRTVEP
ncbi:MAG: hypothetical protein WC378_09995 [Opitutaceae bacterium]